MRLPDWIRAKSFTGLQHTKQMLRGHRLLTVCEEARCPNIAVCFSKPTATFLILGPWCTRNCGFCSIKSSSPLSYDDGEPQRVAMAARELGLNYVVITSVTRDDLPDGGAAQFARTVGALKEILPGVRTEVLTPDFKGDRTSLTTVLSSAPDVFNHNMETVPSLYPTVRPQADYERSLRVLGDAKLLAPLLHTKSGLMVGLGETFDEVVSVIQDIRSTGCDFLTIGQYLRPSKQNLPVKEYIRPEVFDHYRGIALNLGFKGVASSPLARSSMNAEELYLAG